MCQGQGACESFERELGSDSFASVLSRVSSTQRAVDRLV